MNLTLERPTRRKSDIRHCGPVCLVNALKRFDIDRGIAQVTAAVVRSDPFGTRAAKSHLLSAYARACGLNAVTLQSNEAHAWRALQRLDELGFTVILNHQAANARREGHFTIMASVDDSSIVIDDPFDGPGHRHDREEFLDLWRPNMESVGYVAVAIEEARFEPEPFSGRVAENEVIRFNKCKSSIPDREQYNKPATVRCPRCNAVTSLQPAALFDIRDWGDGGLWNCFYCSGCDGAFHPSPCRHVVS
ncbi:MAG: cysteine peptidase family C39 domain-containing protein [Pirellulaceae bacterium]